MSIKNLSHYAKALVGGVVTAATAYQLAVADGITAAEWGSVAVAFLVGTGLVAAIPNKPKDPK